MAATATFLRGKPIVQDAWPTSTWAAGDVIVIGNRPFVAAIDNPVSSTGNTLPGGPSTIKDALEVSGGIYQMAADAAYPVGIYVYYNPTTKQVTGSPTAGGQCVPFGWIVGGPADHLYDGGPTGAAGLCSVLHDPTDDTGMIYNSASVASDVVTNTGSATPFATTVTIPAGQLVAGDTIHVKAAAFVKSQNSNDTNTLVLNVSTANGVNTTVVNTGAVNAHNNAVALIDVDLVFTAVGNSGSFNVVGDQSFGTQGTANRSVVGVLNTACNTNLGVTISLVDTQSSASTSNIVQLVELLVEKRRK